MCSVELPYYLVSNLEALIDFGLTRRTQDVRTSELEIGTTQVNKVLCRSWSIEIFLKSIYKKPQESALWEYNRFQNGLLHKKLSITGKEKHARKHSMVSWGTAFLC